MHNINWLLYVLTVVLIFCTTIADAVTFKFVYFDNVEKDFTRRGWLNSTSLFQRNVEAVGQMFSEFINASNLELITHVFASREVARAGGTFTIGNDLGKSNRTGLSVLEPSPLSKLYQRTIYSQTSEIILYFNAMFVEENYWFDPTPNDRNNIVIPSNKLDFLSIVLHELGHGLGIAGYYSSTPGINYGTLSTVSTIYDDLTFFGGDGKAVNARTGSPNPMFFDGPISKLAMGNGQRVQLTNLPINDPLSSQNFYHFGDCSSPPILEDSLMSGCYTPLGPEYIEITCIDLAVLADIGYPMTNKFYNTCRLPRAPTKAPIKAPTKAPIKAPTKAPIKIPTAPVKVSTAPIKVPTAPMTLPTAPMNVPTVPVLVPFVVPVPQPPPTIGITKCGIFGKSIFCLQGCGFFRRLFNIGGC